MWAHGGRSLSVNLCSSRQGHQRRARRYSALPIRQLGKRLGCKVDNLLRIKLSAFNILQNAVERHEQNHGFADVDNDIVIGYEFELPEDKMTSDEEV